MTVVLAGTLALAIFLVVTPGLPTQGNILAWMPHHPLRLLLCHRLVRITGLIGSVSPTRSRA